MFKLYLVAEIIKIAYIILIVKIILQILSFNAILINGDIMIYPFAFNSDILSVHLTQDKTPNKNDFRLHTHDKCEIYSFLGGKGCFKIEGSSYNLHRGDILIMRPGEAHFIDIDPSLPYTRLAVHFDSEIFSAIDRDNQLLLPFTKRKNGILNLYTSSNFQNTNYSLYLNNIFLKTENQEMQIISNLLPFLNELKTAFDARETGEHSNSLMQRILDYINSRLTENISLEIICEEFFISKPHLCRIFRQATGSTVWEYVTAKRLLLAKELIAGGASPTKIYTECGFGDYSAFYRAYKKRFGISPIQKL